MAINEKDLVVKSNKLILAPNKMSATELKMLALAISLIDRSGERNHIIKIPKSDVIKIMNLKGLQYGTIKKSLKDFVKNSVFSLVEKNKIEIHVLVTDVYWFNDSNIELRFNPLMMGHLYGLQENFTKYHLIQLMDLKRTQSIRLYEILLSKKGFLGKNNIKLSIDELKKMLNLEDKYPIFYDFEKRILKISVEDITKNTDIDVTYRKLKTGRKNTHIVFEIIKKDQELIDESFKRKNNLLSGNLYLETESTSRDKIKEIRAIIKEI